MTIVTEHSVTHVVLKHKHLSSSISKKSLTSSILVMGILEKIAEIEREIARTQRNKGTSTLYFVY